MYKDCVGIVAVGLLATTLGLGGCAGSVPKPQMSKDVVSSYAIDADDNAVVHVTAASGIAVTDTEKTQIQQLIVQKLDERRAHNVANGDAKHCDVTLTLTRFEKGSAFARAMLAGLGQIHLNGDVVVMPEGGGNKLAGFSIAKTFAWGGIYGGSTRIEDVEPVFADGIAAALTGQPAAPEKKK